MKSVQFALLLLLCALGSPGSPPTSVVAVALPFTEEPAPDPKGPSVHTLSKRAEHSREITQKSPAAKARQVVQRRRSRLMSADIMRQLLRNAPSDRAAIWPSASVPYEFVKGYSKKERNQVMTAMKNIEAVTCVRFVPKKRTDYDYVSIDTTKGDSCSSNVGRMGGQQTLAVPGWMGCTEDSVVTHELMHALGLYHEQTRPDRDKYVTINWANIDPEEVYNFDRQNNSKVFGEYDYHSIMHYDSLAFSRNDKPTMIPKKPGVSLNYPDKMSEGDKKKINMLYNCKNVHKSPPVKSTRPSRDAGKMATQSGRTTRRRRSRRDWQHGNL